MDFPFSGYKWFCSILNTLGWEKVRISLGNCSIKFEECKEEKERCK